MTAQALHEATVTMNGPPAAEAGSDSGPVAGERFGGYLLREEIGRGGMGVVHRALHVALNRDVALKLMRSNGLDPAERARFLREAESSAALKHPYIVAVHDVGIERGRLFFSMDLVEGRSLKQLIDEGWSSARDDLLRVLAKLCEAIGYAHRRGIIHRDLKPHNVVVDARLDPHVLDFGLARRIDEKDGADSDSLVGTPLYMSPEQAEGNLDEVDVRSDVWALGVILYSILTGDVPFRSPSMITVIRAVANDPVEPPSARNPGCPWELERVALRALSKRREDRYQSALELRDDLEAWLDGRPVAAARGGWLYRARKALGRNRRTAALAAGVVIAAAGTALGALRAAEADRYARHAALVAAGAGELEAAARARRAGRLPEAARGYSAAAELFTAARQLGIDRPPEAGRGGTGGGGFLLPPLTVNEGALEAEIGRRAVTAEEMEAAARAAREGVERERLASLVREVDAARDEARRDPAGARANLRRALAALAAAQRIPGATEDLRDRRLGVALDLGAVALGAGQLELAEHVVEEVRDLDPARVAAFLESVRRARELALRTARAAEAEAQRHPEEALALYTDALPFADTARDRLRVEQALARVRPEAEMAAARRRVPPGMVLVEGPVLLDRLEVRNADYEPFVRAGGYEDRALWDPEGWAARARFVGADGRPGPLAWREGRAPEGTLDLPVAGISWFEARAFARWRGAAYRLPTDAEWERAAGPSPWLAPATWPAWRAYFHRPGPLAVDAPSNDRAPSGVEKIHGNVREWVVLRTRAGEEVPAVRGGSFASRTEERSRSDRSFRPSAFYRASDLGIRMARSCE